MIAAAATAALFNGVAKAQQYQVTNSFLAPTSSAPVQKTDTTGVIVNYTSMSILTTPNNLYPGIPNGDFTSILGTVGGTIASNSAASSSYFVYDSVNGFQLVGDYSQTSTGGHGSISQIAFVNPGGQVVGYEQRADPNSTNSTILGFESWMSTPVAGGGPGYNNVFLGLTGTSFPNNYYSKATSASTVGAYSEQKVVALSSGGYAVGTSKRYGGDQYATWGTSNTSTPGLSSWVQSSTGGPTEIGLTTGSNAFNFSTGTAGTLKSYSNTVVGVNNTGAAFGTSAAYTNNASSPSTSLGQDGFYYNGSNSTPVGLFYLEEAGGPGSAPSINNSNAFNGITYAYHFAQTSNAGSDYNSSNGRSTFLKVINNLGQVAGYSYYYPLSPTPSSTNTGQTSFIYTPSTATYASVGLNSYGFTTSTFNQPAGVTSFVSNKGAQSSTIIALNDQGRAAGTSVLYVGQGNTVQGESGGASGARATWTTNASGGTVQIGLWNQNTALHVDTYATGSTSVNSTFDAYQESVTEMNGNGLVAGFAARFNPANGFSYGQDAWVYDPNAGPNGTTYPVDPTALTAVGSTYEFTQIYYLGDNGIAVGAYANISGGPYQAFIWSDANPTTSFEIIGVPAADLSGMSTAGFANLVNTYYDDSNGRLIATATTGAGSTVNGLVTFSPVPEPTSLATVAALGGLSLLRRNRRAGLTK